MIGLDISQLGNRLKVECVGFYVISVLTRLYVTVLIECQFVIIFYRCELFVDDHFQSALRESEYLM